MAQRWRIPTMPYRRDESAKLVHDQDHDPEASFPGDFKILASSEALLGPLYAHTMRATSASRSDTRNTFFRPARPHERPHAILEGQRHTHTPCSIITICDIQEAKNSALDAVHSRSASWLQCHSMIHHSRPIPVPTPRFIQSVVACIVSHQMVMPPTSSSLSSHQRITLILHSPSSPARPSSACSCYLQHPCSLLPEPRIAAPSPRPSTPTSCLCRRLQWSMRQYQCKVTERLSYSRSLEKDSIVPFSSAFTSSLIFSLNSGSVGSPFEDGIFPSRICRVRLGSLVPLDFGVSVARWESYSRCRRVVLGSKSYSDILPARDRRWYLCKSSRAARMQGTAAHARNQPPTAG